jgi:hypothetical protein
MLAVGGRAVLPIPPPVLIVAMRGVAGRIVAAAVTA